LKLLICWNPTPYDLSGGEQQRVALAKVMLTEPEVLLLDEPTKGLDSHFKLKLAKILRQLLSEGVTIIMVSHDIEFCGSHGDLCAMFFDGSIITTNTPNRFFSGNSFYTTAANRMSRHLFENAVTVQDMVTLCRENLKREENTSSEDLLQEEVMCRESVVREGA
jgi:ABC-type sulfate/molybdate transport systems ATPase subunit